MPSSSVFTMLSRLKRDQGGSAVAGVGFSLFATILMASIVLTATNVISLNSYSASDAAMSRAIDSRFESYKAAYASSPAEPSAAGVCYPNDNACVTITSVVTTGSATIVTLSAVWNESARKLDQRRTIAGVALSYIVGYDAAGLPVWSAPAAVSASSVVSTLAGSGSPGSANGATALASFDAPTAVAVDGAGNVYVADSAANLIRKVTPAGDVTTVAGSGASGAADGIGIAATFKGPQGIALDSAGNLYVADTGNNAVRKIDAIGTVTTVAGAEGAGDVDGIGGAAKFNAPTGIAVDASGSIFVADTGNNKIRKIDATGTVSAYAGSGVAGNGDGAAASAKFNGPKGIAADGAGNIFITDTGNNKIRKVDATGLTSTLSGTGAAGSADGDAATATFNGPRGVAVASNGSIWVTETGSHQIRTVAADGSVSTSYGAADPGGLDGVGTAARFNSPSGVAADASGAVYVADTGNHKIRKAR